MAAAALLAIGAVQAGPVSWTGAAVQGELLRGTAGEGVTALVWRVPGATDVPVTLAGGRFVVGLDRDAGPAGALVATMVDGSERVVPVAIAPRRWPTQHLNLDPTVGLGPEFARRRPAELARIAAARAGEDPGLTGWLQPFRPPAIGRHSAGFGAGRVYRDGFESVHAGTDIAAPVGTVVVAPAAGRVVLAADHPFTLEGNLLIVDHGGGLTSAFLHLSRIDVVEGETVAAGQPIGAVGRMGRATGPHLHWAVRWHDARIDPAGVVNASDHPD